MPGEGKLVAPRSLIPRLIAECHNDIITHPGWKSVHSIIRKKMDLAGHEGRHKGSGAGVREMPKIQEPEGEKATN